jgi:hypothetical protein
MFWPIPIKILCLSTCRLSEVDRRWLRCGQDDAADPVPTSSTLNRLPRSASSASNTRSAPHQSFQLQIKVAWMQRPKIVLAISTGPTHSRDTSRTLENGSALTNRQTAGTQPGL